MKIKLVFCDWKGIIKNPKGLPHWDSVYNLPEGIELSMGDFHSGTTFDATIDLDKGSEEELRKHLKAGFVPIVAIGK